MDLPPIARGYEGFKGRISRTTAGSEPAWPEQRKAPARSPNIVVIVADDLGYSDIGPYGSEIDTPALDALAQSGVTMVNYHTAPLCSPSRAALLTGINPHRAGFGHVSNFDPGFPGVRVEFGEDIVTLPETLQDNGYATFAIGKWHLVREAAMHAGADKSSWPCQRGFDHYYGSLEGLNSFFEPNQIVRDNTPIDIDQWPEDYYVTDDLTTEAENYIRNLRAHDPSKPFFLYFAHIAMHAPLQAKRVDLAKYRGKYESGWDRLREERFRRQIELGLFPPGTQQVVRNRERGYDVRPWKELSPEEQHRFARYMEVYAAMVDSIDQSTARLKKLLCDIGELDNTIIVFTSDNGGSAEGGPTGSRSYLRQFPQTFSELGWLGDTPIDDELIGSQRAGVHYPRGWAQASNTPFRFYKGQTFAGGVRVPLIVSWPAGLKARGVTRHGYGYVTDVMPTLLELTGLDPLPARFNVPSKEMDGVSLADHWTENIASPHREQYSEIGGHRGLYRDGWKLLSLHDPVKPVDEPRWQLYDIRSDPTEMRDLSEHYPEKVKELSQAWDTAAWHNTVFPLFETAGSGADARERSRPADDFLSEPLRIPHGTATLERYRSLQLMQYRDFRVAVELKNYEENEHGVLFSHGDQLGGYILFVEESKVHFGYNAYGEEMSFEIAPMPEGATSIQMTVTVRDPLFWDFAFTVDGKAGKVVRELPQMTGMAPWTGISVGKDARGPVLWDLRERYGIYPFTGNLVAVSYFPGKVRTPANVIEALKDSSARTAD